MSAQVMLAGERFAYTPNNTPLHTKNGGFGWAAAWTVQNNNVAVPGFHITLAAADSFLSGSAPFLLMGRKLDINTGGAFNSFLTAINGANFIGKPSTTTFWAISLMKKNTASDEVSAYLHNKTDTPFFHDGATHKVGVGYFGAASDSAGKKWWSLKVDNAVFRTNVQIQATQYAKLVLEIANSATNTTLKLRVDATGAAAPPAVLRTVTTNNFIFAYSAMSSYMGDATNIAQMDNIKFATTYSKVIAFASPPPPPPVPTADCKATEIESIRMATCGQSDGSFNVQSNVLGALVSMKNSVTNAVILTSGGLSSAPPPVNFNNLAPGTYALSVISIASNCKDVYKIRIRQDSTTCPTFNANNVLSNDVGVNLNEVVDYDRERAFKNHFKNNRGWQTFTNPANIFNSPGTIGSFTFDVNGYPNEVPKGTNKLFTVVSTNGAFEVGTQYVLKYDGVGDVRMGGVVNNVVSTPNRITFTPTQADAIWVELHASSLGNTVKNIRITRLAAENDNLVTSPFEPDFLAAIAPFKALRFMDWQGTNGSLAVQPTNRTLVDFYSYNTEQMRTGSVVINTPAIRSYGVPWEIMAQLCKTAQKDAWVCVPHNATNAYITAMANSFKTSFAGTTLKVYVEFSNEVWNGQFAQQNAVFNNASIVLPTGANTGAAFTVGIRKYAIRAVQAFNLWHSAWGADKARVIRVLGTQNLNIGVTTQLLTVVKQTEYDAISPSFYFFLRNPNDPFAPAATPVLTSTSSAADIITHANNFFDAQINAYRAQYHLAKFHGKMVVNYEGGQHWLIGDLGGNQNVWAAQINPAIKPLYKRVMRTCSAMGSSLMMTFNLAGQRESQFGSFGHLEFIDNNLTVPASPKYEAIKECALE